VAAVVAELDAVGCDPGEERLVLEALEPVAPRKGLARFAQRGAFGHQLPGRKVVNRARGRIVACMHKAMREAKVSTNWLNQSVRHAQAMTKFVALALASDNAAFRDDVLDFQRRVARDGIYNSLAQLTINAAAPGVPDFYQGTELWDFSLVDPATGGRWTTSAGGRPSRSSPRRAEDRLELFATMTLLRFRREHAELFQHGTYEPLMTGGSRRGHVFAFARVHGAAGAVAEHAPIALLEPLW